MKIEPILLELESLLTNTFDDLLDIDKIYLEQMIEQFYPISHQLYKENSSDAKATSLALVLSISNNIIISKITPTVLILTLLAPLELCSRSAFAVVCCLSSFVRR